MLLATRLLLRRRIGAEAGGQEGWRRRPEADFDVDCLELALSIPFQVIELGLIGTDDFHHLNAHRRWIDIHVFVHSRKFAKQGFGDFPISRNNDFTVVRIAFVQWNFFT